MYRKLGITLILISLTFAGCSSQAKDTPTPTIIQADMPNPASKYCLDQGNRLEIRSETGGEVGYCIFPDNSACEEWAYFRGECQPVGIKPASTEEATGVIIARMLVEPNALSGPSPSSFTWSPSGSSLVYVDPEDGQEKLWLYEASTGEKKILFDPSEYGDNINLGTVQWSPQGDKLLLIGDTKLWIYDLNEGRLSITADSETKTAAMFLPSGEEISFVENNNIHKVQIDFGQVERLTTDGTDTIFNGTLDWVYNEELATRVAQPAYTWSPDGKTLVYMQLNDESLQSHPVTDYRTIPPKVSYTRYPTTGSPNPNATLHYISMDGEPISNRIPLPENSEYILPFFTWTPGGQEVVFMTLSRDHKVLRLNGWNATSGETRTIIEETDPYWISEPFYVLPVYLENDQQFLWLSERDGYMHLYLYSFEGELLRQITQGEWLIDSSAWNLLTPGKPVHVDPTGTWAYLSATKDSPLERTLYRLNIENGELEQLSQKPGFHFAALSADGAYLVEQFSDVDTPPVTSILNSDGSLVEILSQSAGPALPLPELEREFLTIKAHDGVDLYAQIVKPRDFDPQRKYGVIIHWYGGPTLQLVSNRYGSTNIFNHIERDVLYTQAGFLVWRLDNRGSFGRGHDFETPIAGSLGEAALDDQLAGIDYLKTLAFIDPTRICTDGKSFGGFLTLYALIHAPDAIRCGVAGSGPTDWRYYDTIYTERYMGTPASNPDGYAASELITKVDQIQNRPLIIHGLTDTNVHLQNSVNLIEAMMAIDKPFEFVPLPNSDHHYGGDGLVTVLSQSVDYFVRNIGNQ